MKQDSLLARLMSKIGAPEQQPQAEVSEVQDYFKLSTEQAEQITQLSAEITQLNSKLEAAVATVTEADATIKELQSQLETVKTEQTLAAQVAEEKRLMTRKEKITAVVGTERMDALFAATQSMEDAAFEAVVSALNVTAEKESKSPMFVEQGANTEMETSNVKVQSEEAKYLSQKYHKSA